MRIPLVISFLLAAGAMGCASSPNSSDPDVIFLVPGVGGAGGYSSLIRAISDDGRQQVQVFGWGAPLPLFFLNFSWQSIHDDAEQKLAQRINQWRRDHPAGRIRLLGHSAGCGVALGALGRLGDGRVGNVVLLQPSVSPGYDLRPALAHMDGVLHVFYSDRDTTFLSWRTGHFGTYDRVKTRAAGNTGFKNDYPPQKLVQHPYDPRWSELDNEGGHYGVLAEPFARQIVAPLLK